MKRQRMNTRGFTLIETTIAMLVMMIVGLGATSLFLYSVRYNSGASQRSIAMAVAQQRLEVLRVADYDDAGLAFGVYDPETVVVAPSTTSSYTQGATAGVSQTYSSPASAGNYPGAFAAVAATPTPTASPTPSTGTNGMPSGSSTYQVQKQVVPFPIGTSAATATQKQITLRVVPVNGNGNNSWANLNPVVVVFRRSIGAPGPFKQ